MLLANQLYLPPSYLIASGNTSFKNSRQTTRLETGSQQLTPKQSSK